MKRRMIISALAFMAASTTVLAQSAQYSQDAMAVQDQMMARMQMKPSGDPDKDFVLMMIPHHQGAIDMARLELKYGKDPELRSLAERIVADQDKEIQQMQAWQAKHK